MKHELFDSEGYRIKPEGLAWADVSIIVPDCEMGNVRGFDEPRLFGPERYRGAFPVDGWPQSDIGLDANEAVSYGIAVRR